jgi:hypothetical protein
MPGVPNTRGIAVTMMFALLLVLSITLLLSVLAQEGSGGARETARITSH